MLAKDINKFCSYFEQEIQTVAQMQDSLYSRILWVTMLDSLSIAGHPNLSGKSTSVSSNSLRHMLSGVIGIG